MNRRWVGFAVCTLIVSRFAYAGGDKQFWEGSTGDYFVDWNAADLTVRTHGPQGERVLSLRQLAESEWKELLRTGGKAPLEFEIRYRLLSAVGPYLSVEESSYCDCGGVHPSAVTRIRALDLRKTNAKGVTEVSLDEIVPKAEILSALLGDKVVKEGLATANAQAPHSLDQLFEPLSLQTVTVGECGYEFGSDLLHHFAFHHVEKDRVAVRVSLSHAEEVCRGKSVDLGLWLPLPKPLNDLLKTAEAKQGGLLMVDADAIGKNVAVTRYRFSR